MMPLARLLAPLSIAFLLTSCGSDLEVFTVSSRSMEPTLQEGQVIMADMSDRDVQRGDIVILEDPNSADDSEGYDPAQLHTKRVVGLGGETVKVGKGGGAIVDGTPLDEPYLAEGGPGSTGEWKVPEGSAFVLGDNRASSADSRVFGPIPLDLVQGTVVPQQSSPS